MYIHYEIPSLKFVDKILEFFVKTVGEKYRRLNLTFPKHDGHSSDVVMSRAGAHAGARNLQPELALSGKYYGAHGH